MNEIETVQIGDEMPRIGTVSVEASGKHLRRIVVSWISGPRRGKAEIIDLAPAIFEYKLYRPLRDNARLFSTVHLVDDGAALAWGVDDAIDMAATTVERLAEETMTVDRHTKRAHSWASPKSLAEKRFRSKWWAPFGRRSAPNPCPPSRAKDQRCQALRCI